MKIRVAIPRFAKRIQSAPGSGNLQPVHVKIPYHYFNNDSQKVNKISNISEVGVKDLSDAGADAGADRGISPYDPMWDMKQLRIKGTMYYINQVSDSFKVNHQVTVAPPDNNTVVRRIPAYATYEINPEFKNVACLEVDHAVHVDLPYMISKVVPHDLHKQLSQDQIFYGTSSTIKDDVFQEQRKDHPEQFVDEILSARSKHVTVFYGRLGKCQLDKYAIVHLLSMGESLIAALPNVIITGDQRLVVFIDGTGLHPYPPTMAEGSGVGYANADYIVVDAQHVQNGIFDPAPLKKLFIQGLVKKRLPHADGLLLEYLWPFVTHLIDKADMRFYQNCVTLFQHPEDISMNQYVTPGLFLAFIKITYGDSVMWDIAANAVKLHAEEKEPGVHLVKYLITSAASATDKSRERMYSEYLESVLQFSYFKSDSEMATIVRDLIKKTTETSHVPVDYNKLSWISFTRVDSSLDLPEYCFAVICASNIQQAKNLKSRLLSNNLAFVCFILDSESTLTMAPIDSPSSPGKYLLAYAYV